MVPNAGSIGLFLAFLIRIFAMAFSRSLLGFSLVSGNRI